MVTITMVNDKFVLHQDLLEFLLRWNRPRRGSGPPRIYDWRAAALCPSEQTGWIEHNERVWRHPLKPPQNLLETIVATANRLAVPDVYGVVAIGKAVVVFPRDVGIRLKRYTKEVILRWQGSPVVVRVRRLSPPLDVASDPFSRSLSGNGAQKHPVPQNLRPYINFDLVSRLYTTVRFAVDLKIKVAFSWVGPGHPYFQIAITAFTVKVYCARFKRTNSRAFDINPVDIPLKPGS